MRNVGLLPFCECKGTTFCETDKGFGTFFSGKEKKSGLFAEKDFPFSLGGLGNPVFGHEFPVVIGLRIDGAQFLDVIEQIVTDVVFADAEDA